MSPGIKKILPGCVILCQCVRKIASVRINDACVINYFDQGIRKIAPGIKYFAGGEVAYVNVTKKSTNGWGSDSAGALQIRILGNKEIMAPPVSATILTAELAVSTIPVRVGRRMESVASKKE